MDKIENVLSRDGEILQLAVGNSMWPLIINQKDQLLIKKTTAPLKVNDVVLYKRDSGQYVLHRIIGIHKGEFVIRGDNRFKNEYGISDRHVIGILSGIYKDDKYIDCENSFEYKLYVFLLRISFIPRFFVCNLYKVMKKISKVNESSR